MRWSGEVPRLLKAVLMAKTRYCVEDWIHTACSGCCGLWMVDLSDYFGWINIQAYIVYLCETLSDLDSLRMWKTSIEYWYIWTYFLLFYWMITCFLRSGWCCAWLILPPEHYLYVLLNTLGWYFLLMVGGWEINRCGMLNQFLAVFKGYYGRFPLFCVKHTDEVGGPLRNRSM